MRIGELARASGMTPDGVRFYEREGLLPDAQRTAAANYRDFSPARTRSRGCSSCVRRGGLDSP